MSPRSSSLAGLLVAAVAATAFAVAPPTASTGARAGAPPAVPPMAEDPAGDANALNGQGLADLGSTPSDPAQVAEADVLAARITSTYEAVPGPDGDLENVLTGLEFRTRLSATPTATGPALLHRFNGTVDGCLFFVEASTGVSPASPHLDATLRLNGTGCGVEDETLTFETVSGAWLTASTDPSTSELVVTLDLDGADQRLRDLLVPGAYYLLDGVETRGDNVVLVAPVIDEMPGQNGFTVIGDDIPSYEPPPPPPPPPGPDERVGLTEDAITLGLHAPASGAAPLPTTSFNQARDLYWRWVTEERGEQVLGRSTVHVEFRDDKADPNNAGQVCRELAAGSFLVQGLGGTDEIQRCGQLADVDQHPYLSLGVTEGGLQQNPWYFAGSMTFREQGRLLADYVASNPDGLPELGPDAAIGTLMTHTPNLEDALAGWEAGLQEQDLTNLVTYRHARGQSDWYSSVAREFRDRGVEVVHANIPPMMLVDFARTARLQYDYNPRYIGVGVTWGLNATLAGACQVQDGGLDGAVVLSPVPGLDRAPSAFRSAAATFDAPADDIALLLWGAAEQLHTTFLAYEARVGTDLTRSGYRTFLEEAGTFHGGTYPDATWTRDDHFGAGTANVLQADCGTKQFHTLHLDAAGF